MAIARFRARIGGMAKAALLGAAFVVAGAAGCGKKPVIDPEPVPAASEGEKTEKPKAEEKKVAPGLTDLTEVAGAAWVVRADPAPPITGGLKVGSPTAFNGEEEVVVPSAPSAFIALGVPNAKSTYRVYNVRTMEAVGKRMVLPPRSRLVLSPDGKYLAALLKGKSAGTVAVWSTETGGSVLKRELAADTRPFDVQILPGGRLWLALTSLAVEQWGLKDGKQLPAVSFLAPTAGVGKFSPGGRYLLTASDDRDPMHVYDLQSEKIVRARRFLAQGAPKGRAVALAFSPDGEEIAMLWRLATPTEETWGRLACWNFRTGKLLHNQPVARPHQDIDSLLRTEKQVLQFWPGHKGWMLFGHLLVDRGTGAVVHKFGVPRDEGDMQDRRFLDADHVTEAARHRVPRVIKVVALPKEEIAEAVKEAHSKRKRE